MGNGIGEVFIFVVSYVVVDFLFYKVQKFEKLKECVYKLKKENLKLMVKLYYFDL